MRIIIRRPFLLSCCLLAALFFDSTGIMHCCIWAILLHECGHALAYRLLLHKRPVLRLHMGGLALQWSCFAAKGRTEALILLAGPCANLAAAAVTMAMTTRTARFFLWFFCGVNLLMAFFNLLPLGFLDGGRLLQLTLQLYLTPQTVYKVCNVLQWACLICLCCVFLVFDTAITTRLALLCVVLYFCFKSFCVKN